MMRREDNQRDEPIGTEDLVEPRTRGTEDTAPETETRDGVNGRDVNGAGTRLRGERLPGAHERGEHVAGVHERDEHVAGEHVAGDARGEGGRRGAPPRADDGGAALFADDGGAALFADADSDRFRHRWHDVQSAFVDDPRRAVQDADQLVAELMRTLATTFAERKRSLEGRWQEGVAAETEDLRLALRGYRSFFDQLLPH
jgi:hypothetical protein